MDVQLDLRQVAERGRRFHGQQPTERTRTTGPQRRPVAATASVAGVTAARLEMLVEPFRESEPGPHVLAAIDAGRDAGLAIEMGPFASIAEGDLDSLVAAAEDMLRAGFAAGATSVQLHIERL